MWRHTITGGQAILVLALFLMGNTVVLGVNSSAGPDSWLALLLGLAASLPLALFYGRTQRLCPGKDLFAIMQGLFGPVVGRVLTLAVAGYALLVGAAVLRSYADFLRIVSMPETPRLPLLLCLLVLALWALRRGMAAFAKSASVLAVAAGLLLGGALVASIGQMEPQNLLPALQETGQLLPAALGNLAFPFGETLLFAVLLGALRPGERAGKVCLLGLLLGGGVLLAELLRQTMVLGAPLLGELFFPGYLAASIISVGDVLTRIEGVVAMAFVAAGFVKITVCLHAASLGFARLGGQGPARPMRILVALAMLVLAQYLFPSTMELYQQLARYQHWVLPLQLLLPALLWLGAEIKYRKRPHAVPKAEAPPQPGSPPLPETEG